MRSEDKAAADDGEDEEQRQELGLALFPPAIKK